MLVFCVLVFFIIIYKYLIEDTKGCFSWSELLNRPRSCLARAELPILQRNHGVIFWVYIYIVKIIKLKKKYIKTRNFDYKDDLVSLERLLHKLQ